MNEKTGENSFGADMEAVVNLMTGRCEGSVNDDYVENAISKLLSHSKPSASTSNNDNNPHTTSSSVFMLPRVATTVTSVNSVAIFHDMGCYDADEEEFQEEFEHEIPCESSFSSKSVTITTENQEKNHVDWSDIPLGHIGCRLMQTFGDGPNPRADAVSSTLLGTRQLVHMVIKDARALRRKMKLAYLQARSQVTGLDQVKIHKMKQNCSMETLTESDEKTIHPYNDFDAELFFQAFGGISKLSFDPPCGFDEEQLEKLFPEEIHAYRRWKCMHKAATESSNDNPDNILEKKPILNLSGDSSILDGEFSATVGEPDLGNDEDDVAVEVNSNTANPKEWGGHLQGRLSQFDARTEQMKDDFYVKFSEVRRGSFLPPSCLNQEEKIWEKLRKENRPRGRLNSLLVTWETLPAQHVPFLHWLGFSPRSALPLPSEATTNALAFLAYDFFGRIVEKAIFLRCLKDSDTTNRKTTKDGRLILELQPHEQLTEEDINCALNDSTLASKPLYRAASDGEQSHVAQLYFGPGFEDRLEIELDQILLKKIHDKDISHDEKKIRIEEDDLFENLQSSKPVKLKSIMTLRSGEPTGTMSGQQYSVASKRVLNADDSLGQKRPRGRPRKTADLKRDPV